MTVMKKVTSIFCDWWGYADTRTFLEGNNSKPITLNQYFEIFNILNIHGTQLHDSEVKDNKMKGYVLENTYFYLYQEDEIYKISLRHYKVDYKLINATKRKRPKRTIDSAFCMPTSTKIQ